MDRFLGSAHFCDLNAYGGHFKFLRFKMLSTGRFLLLYPELVKQKQLDNI